MCGIIGVFDRRGCVSQFPVDAMRDRMSHRGPDDYGTWQNEEGTLALAHRRLSVIDITSAGHQPMHTPDGNLTIVFNGEIYNFLEVRESLVIKGHSFFSHSDTEVILAAYREWGTDCVNYFIGMFAFCLYDKRENRLFLARDHVGEKPLYFYAGDRLFAFASELKSLLLLPGVEARMDLESLHMYLAYGYSSSDSSLVRDIYKLPPAHAMIVSLDDGNRRTWAYWQPPQYDGESPIDKNVLLEHLESHLEKVIKRQLVADVPVGVLLSGGLDSSILTALASRVSSTPIKTFTIAFAGHGRFDEGPHARLVADHFGTQHHELTAESISLDELPKLVEQFDEPIADHAIVPSYILSRLVREHATVALGGDGGDELFGGYPHYSYMLRRERIRQRFPGYFREAVASVAKYLPPGVKGRNHVLGLAGSMDDAVAHVNMYFDRRGRSAICKLAVPSREPEYVKADWSAKGHDPCRKVMYADFHTTLPSGYLVKVDRASMLASLEVRSPWLDKEIVEFAFAKVPSSLRATRSARKILPRALGKKLLPAALDLNRKQGLTMPLNDWFKGDWGSYSKDVLLSADRDFLDHSQIKRLFRLQERGYNNSNRLMALTFLELWRRQYNVQLPSSG